MESFGHQVVEAVRDHNDIPFSQCNCKGSNVVLRTFFGTLRDRAIGSNYSLSALAGAASVCNPKGLRQTLPASYKNTDKCKYYRQFGAEEGRHWAKNIRTKRLRQRIK